MAASGLLHVSCFVYFCQVNSGKWYDILTLLFLQSSITWLIHAKIGCDHWMPTVFLTLCVVLCIYYYRKSNRLWPLLPAAAILGILCSVMWIGFFSNGCLLGLTILLSWKSRKWRIFADAATVLIVAVTAYSVFISIYAAVYRIEIFNICLSFYHSVVTRYTQGGIPSFQPTMWGKLCYAMKCLFIDSTQMDHDDKYLEGVPAVSWLFAIFFFVGLILMMKRRSVADRCIFLWLVACFLPITFVWLFCHRYSLLILPAMATISAIGAVNLVRMSMRTSRNKSVVFFPLVLTGLLLFSIIRLTPSTM